MESTDVMVELRAQEALALSPLLALRRLTVRHDDDRLVITGSVATFYQKQQAQELVRQVADGLHVVNEVEVT
jgi:transketolase